MYGDLIRATKVIDMTVWKFGACPRCHGDMFLERERGEWYLQCLQCSYQRELRAVAGRRSARFKAKTRPLSLQEANG